MPASVASSEPEEEQQNFIIDIDTLQSHGINAADIAKLKLAMYFTVGSVQSTPTKRLLLIKGFSDIKVEKVKEACKKCQAAGSRFMTAAELLLKRKTCFRLSTGSASFDKMLGGGFESRSVNEVFGEFRCGKTQLSHTLAVVAQLPVSRGGGNGKVVILDTEGTFRPERIIQIAERFDIDPEAANENIIIHRANNSEDQQETLCALGELFVGGEYRLLIVDSILNLFRSDYQGRGELNERQQKLNVHLRKLADFAEEFNICVFMTNQVQSDPGAMSFAGADGRKPVGGHVLAHASATRVLLRKGRADERVAKLMDSPDCPESEATYVITQGGINDPDKA
ncbi:meiotic recombination protein dmc1 [Zymoseptoria brevis]|uniref:Meiotic recombination protein dmc1 n=1 Tax=Zymoseptoria brevis TaxID=1047168 RepID=A0A0F4GK94_9PEZI|nr:meiotic recombination protein dmc1 [Zymoseptoria brevis]